MILAEANVRPEEDLDYFGRDADRMHMMFNFQVNQNLFYALARPIPVPVPGTEADEAAPDELSMGPVPAQPR